MSKRIRNILIGLAGLFLLAVLIYQIPYVKSVVSWRIEKFTIYAKNTINPIGPVPTALPVTPQPATPTIAATVTSTPVIDLTPSVTPTVEAILAPLPAQASIAAPPYEKQTPNNCGPATLSMALHIYGWDGSQSDIANVIKPILQDRNVNPEELRYYVRTQAGWLNMEYRVGGNIETLKRLIAANYPVIVESVTALDPNDALGPDDDLWAAHYILLTGYDDNAQTFTIQDSYHGANLTITYAQLEKDWYAFNNMYMVIYFPKFEEEVKTLLASNWDPDLNRQMALDASQAESAKNPTDAFAWFNLGSNLVYFDRYDEAALAYDKARSIGLPLRMFRYQFGPFLAYFHSNRNDDLLVLTDYARGVTEMSEEAWLWYGFGLYRKGDYNGALKAWQKADKVNPNFYEDQAKKAMQLVQ
jgi:tetratricopeptide (TPR) repeat protein